MQAGRPAALYGEGYIRSVHGGEVGKLAHIIAVKRDIQLSDRHPLPFDTENVFGKPLRQRDPAAADPEKADILHPAVAFDYFVRYPFERAGYCRIVHKNGLGDKHFKTSEQ